MLAKTHMQMGQTEEASMVLSEQATPILAFLQAIQGNIAV